MQRDGGARASTGEPEQRRLRRFRVDESDGARASVQTSLGPANARVTDLSLGGAGLLVSNAWACRGPLAIRLDGLISEEVPVELVHCTHPAAGSRAGHSMGVRYRSLRRDVLRELCRYLVARHSQSVARPRFLDDRRSQFPISVDPSRIRRLLLHCCRRRRVLRLFRAGGAPIGSLAPLALQGGELIGRLDLLLAEHVEPGEPVLLLHSSTAGATLLLTRLRAVEGDRARLDLPAQLLESGGRRLGRLVPPADFPVYFEFLHPLVPGLRARKRVRELGFDGLRFDLDVGGDLLVPGTAVDSAVVLLDEESLPCRGTVRHTVELLDGSYQCGFQIVEFQGPGREVWVERVLARMNPDVEEARPRDLEEAWEVFRRSGYLEEKPVEQLLLLREPFLRTWRELLRTRASAHFWLHRPGRFAPAVGTICVSKIHGTTWLVHHMSVDRAEPAISKLLILADLAPRTVLQWLVSTHPTSHVMLFYDAHTSFNQASWTDFFARHVEQGLVSLRQLWLREYLVSSIRARPDERTWVRPPTPAETERISTHLLATDGALRCRALDLDIRGLSLAPDREAAGSAAEREVLAVGEGDQALGFALVESGPPGINIFSLYDTARAVVWDEQPERRQRLQSALLAEVRRHYRERGRHSFLQVAGEGDVEWPETPIFSAPAMQALVSLEIAPFWFQHLERIWTQGGGSQ